MGLLQQVRTHLAKSVGASSSELRYDSAHFPDRSDQALRPEQAHSALRKAIRLCSEANPPLANLLKHGIIKQIQFGDLKKSCARLNVDWSGSVIEVFRAPAHSNQAEREQLAVLIDAKEIRDIGSAVFLSTFALTEADRRAGNRKQAELDNDAVALVKELSENLRRTASLLQKDLQSGTVVGEAAKLASELRTTIERLAENPSRYFEHSTSAAQHGV